MICNDTIFRGEQRMERDQLLLTEYKGGTIENWLQLTANEGEDLVDFNVTQPKCSDPTSPHPTPPQAGNNERSLNAI